MPDLLQSGTLNTPALAAVKRAVDFIKKETVQAIGEHDRYLANMLIERLKNINGVTVYGVSGSKRTGTVAFNIKPYDSVYVSEILDKKYRICTRGGLHCAYPAHCALGTNKTGAVRASFGYFNTNNDVKKLADAVYAIASGK